ncbi:putative BPI/LBP family protein [Hibiscus syriacus]|uniref:glucan endo-1,3-beta-D-glucosidase n=1 Tax=Hibiscus syriacus TaxID=106335 RepID=A0A6A2YPD2_HIBSY|nr:putative BPI/LBP family protein [Hibiscus syriacus]
MTSQAFSFLILFLSALAVSDAAGSVGINYGRVANNLPSPDKVVQLLKSQGVTKVKIFDTDPAVLSALANTGISVVVCLPNEKLASAAGDQSFADNWVQTSISKYYPATKIEAIAIGNEIIAANVTDETKVLVPAMKAIQASLVKFNLDSNIKVSSPIAMTCLENSYPSSAGSFKQELVDVAIKRMLDFLKQTGSYLMVNIYPFFAYEGNSNQISLDYALFKQNPGVVDSGWPSAGDVAETGASQANAATYNGNLIRRVLSGKGTPLRPKDPLNVYIFALFNENQKPGPTSERNYGLFYPNMQRVYNIAFSKQGLNVSFPPPMNIGKSGNRPPSTNNRNRSRGGVTKRAGQTWCLANPNADRQELQAALDYACGEGGADCGPIQSDGSCFNPDSLEAHASYAFNSYYQKKARVSGSCDFHGAAYVSMQPPLFGNCQYPTGY